MLQKLATHAATHVTGGEEADHAAKFKSQLDTLKQNLMECTQENEGLVQQVHRLKRELDASKHRAEALEAQIVESSASLSQEAEAKLRKEVESISDRLAERDAVWIKEVQREHAAVVELQKQLQDSRAAAAAAAATTTPEAHAAVPSAEAGKQPDVSQVPQAQQQQQQQRQLEVRLSEGEAQLSACTAQLEQARAQADSVHAELAASRAEGVAARTQVEQLQAALSSSHDELARLQGGRGTELADLEAQLGLLRGREAALLAQLEEAAASKQRVRDLERDLEAVRAAHAQQVQQMQAREEGAAAQTADLRSQLQQAKAATGVGGGSSEGRETQGVAAPDLASDLAAAKTEAADLAAQLEAAQAWAEQLRGASEGTLELGSMHDQIEMLKELYEDERSFHMESKKQLAAAQQQLQQQQQAQGGQEETSTELGRLRTQLAEAQATLSAQGSEPAVSPALVSMLQQQVKSAQRDLEASQDELARVRSELNQRQSELEALRAAKEEECTRLSEACAREHEACTEAHSQRAALEAKLEYTESQLIAATQETEAQALRMQDVQAALFASQQQSEQLQQQCQSLQQQCMQQVERSGTDRALQETCEGLQRRCETLQQQCTQHEEQCARLSILEREHQRLQQHCTQLEQQCEQLRVQCEGVHALHEKLVALQQHCTELEQQCEQLRVQCEGVHALQERCEVLQQECAGAQEARTECEALREACGALQQRCGALEQQCEGAQGAAQECGALRETCEALQQRCGALEQQREGVQAELQQQQQQHQQQLLEVQAAQQQKGQDGQKELEGGWEAPLARLQRSLDEQQMQAAALEQKLLAVQAERDAAVNDLDDRDAFWKGEIAAKASELERAHQHATTLKEAFLQEQQAAEAATVAEEEARRQLQQAQEDLAAKEAACATLRTELDAALSDLQSVRAALASGSQLEAQLEAEVTALRAAHTELESERQRLLAELDEARQRQAVHATNTLPPHGQQTASSDLENKLAAVVSTVLAACMQLPHQDPSVNGEGGTEANGDGGLLAEDSGDAEVLVHELSARALELQGLLQKSDHERGLLKTQLSKLKQQMIKEQEDEDGKLHAQEAEASAALAGLNAERDQLLQQLDASQQQIQHLQSEIAGWESCLAAKESEVANLTAALGELTFESEAAERLRREARLAQGRVQELAGELSAAQREIEAAHAAQAAAEAATQQAHKFAEERRAGAMRVADECAMLRRALDQAVAQVKSVSSESSAMVDKRIMAKLLVTYFERGCAQDVLALMARMLNMGEQEVQKITAVTSKRGLLSRVAGAPIALVAGAGRVAGRALGAGNSGSDGSGMGDENSLATQWVQFLLSQAEMENQQQQQQQGGQGQQQQQQQERWGSGSAASGSSRRDSSGYNAPYSGYSGHSTFYSGHNTAPAAARSSYNGGGLGSGSSSRQGSQQLPVHPTGSLHQNPSHHNPNLPNPGHLHQDPAGPLHASDKPWEGGALGLGLNSNPRPFGPRPSFLANSIQPLTGSSTYAGMHAGNADLTRYGGHADLTGLGPKSHAYTADPVSHLGASGGLRNAAPAGPAFTSNEATPASQPHAPSSVYAPTATTHAPSSAASSLALPPTFQSLVQRPLPSASTPSPYPSNPLFDPSTSTPFPSTLPFSSSTSSTQPPLHPLGHQHELAPPHTAASQHNPQPPSQAPSYLSSLLQPPLSSSSYANSQGGSHVSLSSASQLGPGLAPSNPLSSLGPLRGDRVASHSSLPGAAEQYRGAFGL